MSALQELKISFHESEFDSGQNLTSFVGSFGQHVGFDPSLSHVDAPPSVPSYVPLRPSVGPSVVDGFSLTEDLRELCLHWESPAFLLQGKSFSDLPP